MIPNSEYSVYILYILNISELILRGFLARFCFCFQLRLHIPRVLSFVILQLISSLHVYQFVLKGREANKFILYPVHVRALKSLLQVKSD